MGGMDWLLEVVLIGLLGLTLVHAVRLERALGTLRRERGALGDAVAGFDSSTRQAEAGLDRLHSMTHEAAQQVARKIEGAAVLKDDLTFLAERGEHLADRLERLIRTGRTLDPVRAPDPVRASEPIRAPDPVRPREPEFATAASRADTESPRLRSKSERDLLQALRVAR